MLNLRVVHTVSAPESIKWFIEDQASLRSQDSAPRPPPSPPSPVSRCLSFSSFLCHVSPVDLTDGRGGSGRGAKSYDREKAWTSINHSILSDLQHIFPSPPYYFPYVKVLRPTSRRVCFRHSEQNLSQFLWMFCPAKTANLVLLRAGHSLIFSRFAIRSPLNFLLWIADDHAFIFWISRFARRSNARRSTSGSLSGKELNYSSLSH